MKKFKSLDLDRLGLMNVKLTQNDERYLLVSPDGRIEYRINGFDTKVVVDSMGGASRLHEFDDNLSVEYIFQEPLQKRYYETDKEFLQRVAEEGDEYDLKFYGL